MYLTHKMVCRIHKISCKRTRKQSFISLSFESPLSNKPPSGVSQIKQVPQGLNRALMVLGILPKDLGNFSRLMGLKYIGKNLGI